MRSTMSVFGLYNYDNSIFDNFVVPEEIDKETTIQNILIECAELECLFPNPEMMKYAIGVWSNKEIWTWNRMAKALAIDYNPLDNYDRNEHIVDVEERNLTRSDTETRNLKQTSKNSGTDTSTNQVSAFNDPGFSDRDKNTFEHGAQNVSDNTGTLQIAGTQGGDITRTHDNRTHGNIGVTTSQQMLESEIALAKRSNLINYIVDAFKQRFCLLVY